MTVKCPKSKRRRFPYRRRLRVAIKKVKSYQHAGFPSGPPPQYSLRLKPLNFEVRMGFGALGLVWPIAIVYCESSYINPRRKRDGGWKTRFPRQSGVEYQCDLYGRAADIVGKDFIKVSSLA